MLPDRPCVKRARPGMQRARLGMGMQRARPGMGMQCARPSIGMQRGAWHAARAGPCMQRAQPSIGMQCWRCMQHALPGMQRARSGLGIQLARSGMQRTRPAICIQLARPGMRGPASSARGRHRHPARAARHAACAALHQCARHDADSDDDGRKNMTDICHNVSSSYSVNGPS